MSGKIDFGGFIGRLRKDREFRTVLATLGSSCVTAVIGTFQLLLALFSGGNATWPYTLSAYYYALAVTRVILLLSRRAGLRKRESAFEKEKRDAANYLAGGALLVFVTLCYSGIIVLVTVKGYHYEYSGYLIYAMALYAFYKVISATVKAAKYQKFRDYTLQAVRNVNLADGAVSIVSLQSAMLFAFSDGNVLFARTMNAVVGGFAGVAILALGTLMIVGGYRRLNGLRETQRES